MTRPVCAGAPPLAVRHDWTIQLDTGLATWRCQLCGDVERMTAISLQDPERIYSLSLALMARCRRR